MEVALDEKIDALKYRETWVLVILPLDAEVVGINRFLSSKF